MSQGEPTPLGRSLDVVDRIRQRVLAGGWLAVVVTLGAYGYAYHVFRTSDDVERLIGASFAALTCLIAWAEFAVILIVLRMTGRILRAIELALGREG